MSTISNTGDVNKNIEKIFPVNETKIVTEVFPIIQVFRHVTQCQLIRVHRSRRFEGP
jgi:hypothetical protein